MKKYIGILIFLSLFLIANCKPRQNINIYENISKEQIIDNIFLQEKELITNIEEKSILSTFSHLNADISQYYLMNIDTIRIYENINKETNYIEIVNKEVMLLRIPESENWLYVITEDLIYYGFIYIYDISKESFYGNLEINSRSGNYYLSRLYREHEIVKNNYFINRHGPLLEIIYNENVIRLWDSFFGISTVQNYKHLLYDYYEEYEQILYFVIGHGFVMYYIKCLKSQEVIFQGRGVPNFNKSRETIIILHQVGIEFATILRIYYFVDNKYTLIENSTVPGRVIEAFWNNNDEFQINFIHDFPWNENYGEDGTIFINRSDNGFEIIRGN